jgi:2-polyprenyl-6-methoxyphenol hydroxylase-like FAD-dependent oxidoreductase
VDKPSRASNCLRGPVPSLPRWTSKRVALIGDAAHALSPHISAGGTLGVEDVHVLTRALRSNGNMEGALSGYEENRIPHYARVRELAYAAELAQEAEKYALVYARFSHWMLNEGYRASRT